jgi:PHD/YefM family antitoxin component YafN of YafNO toxin-antitoxin module
MLNTQFIKNLTDLRLDPAKITELAQSSDCPVYIFNRSKPVSVLLNINFYQELIDKLEDALDALEMKEFEKKTRSKENWISHEELLKNLKD